MDYPKIGAFIVGLRKKKKMTQTQLANLLAVSPKTVSKWENGGGLPDLVTIGKLCKILDISINELLSGERLTAEQYVEQAEDNLSKLLDDEQRKNALHKRIRLYWVMTLVQALFIGLTIVAMILMTYPKEPMISPQFTLTCGIVLVVCCITQLVLTIVSYYKAVYKCWWDVAFLVVSILCLPVCSTIFVFLIPIV